MAQPGSPDAHVLRAAGRDKQGLRPVNAFTARDATTLDYVVDKLRGLPGGVDAVVLRSFADAADGSGLTESDVAAALEVERAAFFAAASLDFAADSMSIGTTSIMAASAVHAAQEVHVSSVAPAAFDSAHNGGVSERLTAPAAGTQSHIHNLISRRRG